MVAYKVGQVLFVIPSNGKASLIPIQIVEEISKKTLQGTVLTYMARKGNDSEDRFDVAQVDGEIFDSATLVKRTLVERSTVAIGRVVDQAVALAGTWYSGAFEETAPAEDIIELRQREAPIGETGEIGVVLADGKTARVKLPESLK